MFRTILNLFENCTFNFAESNASLSNSVELLLLLLEGCALYRRIIFIGLFEWKSKTFQSNIHSSEILIVKLLM